MRCHHLSYCFLKVCLFNFYLLHGKCVCWAVISPGTDIQAAIAASAITNRVAFFGSFFEPTCHIRNITSPLSTKVAPKSIATVVTNINALLDILHSLSPSERDALTQCFLDEPPTSDVDDDADAPETDVSAHTESPDSPPPFALATSVANYQLEIKLAPLDNPDPIHLALSPDGSWLGTCYKTVCYSSVISLIISLSPSGKDFPSLQCGHSSVHHLQPSCACQQ